MKFGLHNSVFTPSTGNVKDIWPETRDRAQWAEANGFSYFSVMDHLMQIPGNGPVDAPFLEAWTTLGALADATKRIHLTTLVTSIGYRNPALLAKMVTTLDVISGGRAVLGIGGGWFEAEYNGYNFEFPRAGVRLGQLRDGVRLIKTMWRDPRATYEGKYFVVRDAIMEPKPIQPGGIRVLIGGGGEQVTLKVMAQEANIVNMFHGGGGPAGFAHKIDVLRKHCQAVGRNIAEIELTTTERVTLAATTQKALDKYQSRGGNMSAPWKGLVGTPDDVIKMIGEYRKIGTHGIMLGFPGYDKETMDLFAKEVLPAVREDTVPAKST